MAHGKAAAQKWWQENAAEALPLLPFRERHMVECYYGLCGQPPQNLDAIGRWSGLTKQAVQVRVAAANVRVDRASLIRSGPVMQLIVDYDTAHAGVLGLQELAGGRMHFSLSHQGLESVNALLDKSAQWLQGVGVSTKVIESIRATLATVRLYLRGEVPNEAHLRTTLPHTLTR